MAEDRLDKSALVKFSGLALGILIGGPIGAIVFTPLRLRVPATTRPGHSWGDSRLP